MLRRLFGRIQRSFAKSEPYFLSDNPKYSQFNVGVGTYGYPDVGYFDAGANLRIGKFCSIAPEVTILLGGEHHHGWVTTYPFSLLVDDARELPGYPFTKGDVIIGNDVWIGYGALILSGVTIGDGAVIAARSLVTKDVKPYSIVGGAPAKHLRFRFDEATIAALTRIAWWDWPEAEIEAARAMLQSPNIDEFIQHFEKRGTR